METNKVLFSSNNYVDLIRFLFSFFFFLMHFKPICLQFGQRSEEKRGKIERENYK